MTHGRPDEKDGVVQVARASEGSSIFCSDYYSIYIYIFKSKLFLMFFKKYVIENTLKNFHNEKTGCNSIYLNLNRAREFMICNLICSSLHHEFGTLFSH